MYIVLVCRDREGPGVEPHCASQVTAAFTFTGEFHRFSNQISGFDKFLFLILIFLLCREREMTPRTDVLKNDVINRAFSNYSDSTTIINYL